jgi:hypothetical protein
MHNGMVAYFLCPLALHDGPRLSSSLVSIAVVLHSALGLTPSSVVSRAVLLPVNSVKIKNKDGLAQFTCGSIPRYSQVQYAAHLILASLGTLRRRCVTLSIGARFGFGGVLAATNTGE